MRGRTGPIGFLFNQFGARIGRLKRKVIWSLGLPEEVVLNDMPVGPLKFHAYSRIERYRSASYGGEYEALEHFLQMLKPTDVVYDIGASIGLYAIAAAKSLTSGTVYAFEPDPNTRARLLENIRINGGGAVKVIDWAVSDAEGEITLFTDGARGFAPSLVLQERDGSPTGRVHVQAYPLDLALSRDMLPIPDVAKIDIEGAEGLCLEGARRLLMGEFGRPPRVLFLEIHPDFLPKFETSAEEIKSLVLGYGYEPCWSRIRGAQAHLCLVHHSVQAR